MKRRIIITALAALAFPLASLAQDAGTVPTTPPATVRASGATTRPAVTISQAEALALRKENAELRQQIKELKAQLAKTKTVATTPTPGSRRALDPATAAMYKTNKETYDAFVASIPNSTLSDMTQKAKDNGWKIVDPTLTTQSGTTKFYTVDLAGGYPINNKEFSVTVNAQGVITSFQISDRPEL